MANETFYGYRFTAVVEEKKLNMTAKHDGPTKLLNEDDLLNYLIANVIAYPEIRIVDGGDSIVMHVVNQQLVFPLPPGLSRTTLPTWSAERKKFVPATPN